METCWIRAARRPGILSHCPQARDSTHEIIIGLNEEALEQLTCEKSLAIVPGGGHLFEEPGTLDRVVSLTRAWFIPQLRQGS